MKKFDLLTMTKEDLRLVEDITNVLKANNVNVGRSEEWGAKKLAYNVVKDNVLYTRAFYNSHHFETDSFEMATKVEKEVMKIDGVLKTLVVDITERW
jgi:ribosomal protein S6